MNVVEIIKLTATYLQLNHLLQTTTLGGTSEPTSENIEEINLLLKCVNLVNNIIAGEYFKLTKCTTIKSDNGMVYYDQLASGNKLNQILSVKDVYGSKKMYRSFDTYLKTTSGVLEVTYSYVPNAVVLNDTITSYATKISERIFAYGVASEYCYIMSLYDDAAMWDSRFKGSLQSVISKKSDMTLKQRRWL